MDALSAKELLDTCERVLDDLQNLIRRSRPPKGGPDRLRVALVLTMAEQFEATLRLARAQMITHAATQVRSMIEALLAMNMLATDPEYVDQMRYEQARGQRRVYEGVLADPHIPTDLKDLIQTAFEACHAECESFRAKGRKPRKISDDFAAAKLWHLVGPYSMLCAFSHNDLAVLALRHIGEKGVAFRQLDDQALVQSVMSTALQVVMDATNQFGQIAKFPDDHFDSLFTAMNQQWRVVLDRCSLA